MLVFQSGSDRASPAGRWILARMAGSGLGARLARKSNVQRAGAEAGAAHSCIADAHHVPDSLLQEFLRDRDHAVLGRARPALRPRIAQHQDAGRINFQRRVVNARGETRTVLPVELRRFREL
jgi:hypothetical protein